jgi:hypothetical protein
MSSTVSLNTINAKIDLLIAELADLRAQQTSLKSGGGGAAASSAAKPVKEKKERKKREGPPSAWIVFTNRVRELLRANGYEGADLGKVCQMFCGALKDENKELSSWKDEDILARRAAWTVPATTKQAEAGLHWKNGKKVVTPSGSVATADDDGEDGGAGGGGASTDKPKKERKNPWAGLTEEQRAAKVAAMKAGKAAKKAADSGAAPSEDADGSAPSVHEAAPPSPKPSAAAVSSSAVTAAKAQVNAASSGSEFKGVMVGGKRYLVNLESGHAYNRGADGSQGEWAGIFHRTGGPKGGPWVDDSVAEPTADDDEDDLVFDE